MFAHSALSLQSSHYRTARERPEKRLGRTIRHAARSWFVAVGCCVQDNPATSRRQQGRGIGCRRSTCWSFPGLAVPRLISPVWEVAGVILSAFRKQFTNGGPAVVQLRDEEKQRFPFTIPALRDLPS